MNRVSPFVLLVAASGVMHLAGAGGALVYLSGAEPAVIEKTSLRVALGSRGASAGQPVEAVPQEAPDTQPEPPPEKRPEPKPKPKVPSPEPVAEPVQEPEPETLIETTETPEPEPEKATSQPAAVAGNAGQTGTVSDTEMDTDGEKDDAGYQAMLVSYDGIVLGHLARFKTFPPAARMRGEEGYVGVEFVIGRDGQMVKCRLLETSGSRRLDKAALSQLRSAAPYPAPPDQADWTTRTYRTEMRYSLN
ncbi:TonB family protein [Hyphomonas adhaerens MHS-3]|uniref:Protein TonB n=1 Tax=Hyphomonas adhaerens MHS-3 TaxID=1280949 RepID=A0A069DZV5_9PROT|nr:energy transducer TonB [Hyphomonas adhaerens]KCZ82587.1 TonB family protein [Hyphomonas adhaerens MHS-3]